MKEKQSAKKDKKINKETAKQHMLDFKKEGVSVLEKLSETELENMIIIANEQYYNTKIPIATDAEYDIIVEYMERNYPNNLVLEGGRS